MDGGRVWLLIINHPNGQAVIDSADLENALTTTQQSVLQAKFYVAWWKQQLPFKKGAGILMSWKQKKLRSN
jgi:hypothetical protein